MPNSPRNFSLAVCNMCTETKVINPKKEPRFAERIFKKVIYYVDQKIGPRIAKPFQIHRSIKKTIIKKFKGATEEKKKKIVHIDELISSYRGSIIQFSFKDCNEITDEDLKKYAASFFTLENLNLYGCSKLTNLSCHTLQTMCPNLTVLDIGSCPKISDDGLKLIGLGCQNLKKLNISWCKKITEVGINELAGMCQDLICFEAKGCYKIKDKGVSILTKICSKLEVLNLFACDTLTDAAVVSISENCPLLRYLSISNCVLLTDKSLIAMGEGLKNLKTVEAAVSNFTDTGFAALTKGCPLIEMLDLDCCFMITDITLFNIAKYCANIQVLCLSNCDQITDRGIQSFASTPHPSQLAVLELDSCDLISNHTLHTLGKLPNLKRAELFDCYNVTVYGMTELMKLRPDILLRPLLDDKIRASRIPCFFSPHEWVVQIIGDRISETVPYYRLTICIYLIITWI